MKRGLLICRPAARGYRAVLATLALLLVGPQRVKAQASTNTPAGLPADVLPQMVLMSFDDFLTTERYNDLLPLISTGHLNPNGSALRMTFFINTLHNDFYYTHHLWAKGHEIAVHTMSNSAEELPDRSAAQWRREIVGGRRLLAAYAALPEEDLVGFRAPQFWYTPVSFFELHRAGFLYDASAAEYLTAGGLSKTTGARIYPYELVNGLEQIPVPNGIAFTNSLPGLYEVPVYPLMSNDASFVLSDSLIRTNTQAYLYALKSTFNSHYQGNRAPMTVIIHPQNLAFLPDRVAMYTNFIAWANGHSNTWFVTTREAVEFVQHPQSAEAMATNPVYAPPARAALEEEAFQFCDGLGLPLRIHGPCPPVYPRWFNQYHEVVGGTACAHADYRYTVQDGSNVYPELVAYSLVVSNDTPYEMVSWRASFTLLEATNRRIIEASEVVDLGYGSWDVAPLPNAQALAPGQVNSNLHMLVRLFDPEVPAVLEDLRITAQTFQPMQPQLQSLTHPSPGSVTLDWRESGYEYLVETADRLPGPWQTVTTLVYATEWTEHVVELATSGFYRVRSLP